MKRIKFLRFGGLSPVKQEGYGKDTFHAPPARYGIYCFPETAMERFLLGKGVFDNRRMVPVDKDKVKKDKDGYPLAMLLWKDIKSEKKFNELYERMYDLKSTDPLKSILEKEIEELKEKNQVYCVHAKPRKFEYCGKVWHHLGLFVKGKDILRMYQSWVLTSYNVWLEAFKRCYVNDHVYSSEWKGLICCSKDHLEVFIESIKESK